MGAPWWRYALSVGGFLLFGVANGVGMIMMGRRMRPYSEFLLYGMTLLRRDTLAESRRSHSLLMLHAVWMRGCPTHIYMAQDQRHCTHYRLRS